MANLKAHELAAIAGNFIPPGVIMPFAGATAPAGWLLCDGSEISETTYANLFAAIGATYNTQANPVAGENWPAPSAGNFRVPDYRGLFLRGTGTPSGLDAVSLGGQQVQKTKKPITDFTTASQALSGGSAEGQSLGATSKALSGGSASGGGHDHTINFHNSGLGGTSLVGQAGDSAWADASFLLDIAGTGSHSHPVTGNTDISHSHAASVVTGTCPASTVNGGGDNETRPINKGVNYIIKY